MRLGMGYAYWGHDWKCDYVEMAKKVASFGFTVYEIGAGHLAAMSDSEIEKLKATCDELGLLITTNIGPAKDQDVSSKDPAIRKNGVEFMTGLLKNMSKIGSPTLAGAMYNCWPGDFTDVDKEGAWERSIPCLQQIGSVAEDLGITCALEVLNRFETYVLTDVREGLEYCKLVDRKSVNLLLDTFHMNIEEPDVIESVHLAKGMIGHVHIGEANRNLPGTGAFNWDGFFGALKGDGYTGTVVIEPFPFPGGEVGRDVHVWRDLSGGADKAQADINMQKSVDFLMKYM